jgi:uncharacterized protein YndB with AHSA1/START domain
MPLSSSEAIVTASLSDPLHNGPALEHSTDSEQLRIRARRAYDVSREELFAAWTSRTALDLWLRLRSRSRVMLAPQVGGAFRLELAEGPTIHVITGLVIDIHPSEFLSLSWSHHAKSDQASIIEVSFRERNRRGEVLLLHREIESRREAAWLMKLWSNALARLGGYLAEGAPLARSA